MTRFHLTLHVALLFASALLLAPALIITAYYHGRADRSLLNDFDARVIELGMTRKLAAAEIAQLQAEVKAGDLGVQNHNLIGLSSAECNRLRALSAKWPTVYKAAIAEEIKIIERMRAYDEAGK